MSTRNRTLMTGHYYNILLVVLCGLPASGKSTLVARLQTHLNRVYPDCPLSTASWTKCEVHTWSLDELMPQWHAPDTATPLLAEPMRSFKQDRASIQAQVEMQLQELVSNSGTSPTCTSTGHILLIDDNMYYTSMRHAYYQLAQQYKVTFMQLWVQCDVALVILRNAQRLNSNPQLHVPEPIIRRMAERFEPPLITQASYNAPSNHNTNNQSMQVFETWQASTLTWQSTKEYVDINRITTWIHECFLPGWQHYAKQQYEYEQIQTIANREMVLSVYLFIY
ncbi:hypothetical protein BDF22DRAFT_311155 [Syncephalis plumigaleata]|nr:hypothetical protein BDF22DRAFT_311155 [Syncephalis plumigaleata]